MIHINICKYIYICIFRRYYIAQCWVYVFFDTDCIIYLSYLQSTVKFVIAICSNRDILNTAKRWIDAGYIRKIADKRWHCLLGLSINCFCKKIFLHKLYGEGNLQNLGHENAFLKLQMNMSI